MPQININFIPPVPDTYIVGGTVRDILLGNPPSDWDLVTLKDPESLAREIAGQNNGRVVVLGKSGKQIFRVVIKAPFQKPPDPELSEPFKTIIDISSASGRTIEADLARRDFTINAMAISTDGGILIDTHQGEKDLRDKKIRMVAQSNLRADPLRLLRAYRIAATYGFTIDPETRRAISVEAFRIHEAAAERIRDELIKLLTTPRACLLLKMMDGSGLLDEIFPELVPLKNCSQNAYHQYNVFDHTLQSFDFLEKLLHGSGALPPETAAMTPFLPLADHFPLLKLAILLHDIGKPAARSTDDAGRIHFYGHEQQSADMARIITRRLRFSSHDQTYVDAIIRNHIRPLSLFIADSRKPLSPKTLTRFFLQSGDLTRDLLIHTAADIYGKGIPENTRAFMEFIQKILVTHSETFLPRKSLPSLISGDDLIQVFGLTPAPRFAAILAHIEEARLSGAIRTRAQALDQVKKMLHAE